LTNNSTQPPTEQPRKRGAQPGNTNAVKHGFYSNALNSIRRARLAEAREIALDDISEEIAVNREQLYAILSEKPENFELWCLVMRTLTRSVAVQFAMRPTAAARLDEATSEVIADMANLLRIAEGGTSK
jgi:hypothetical protein